MMRKVLIPLDGSELCERALDRGLSQFPGELFHVLLVRCIDLNETITYTTDFPSGAPLEQERHRQAEQGQAGYLQEKADFLKERGHRVETIILNGDPVDGILATAWSREVELIVMTTHGHSGIKRLLLGSVAEGVTRRANLPVLLLPPAESLR